MILLSNTRIFFIRPHTTHSYNLYIACNEPIALHFTYYMAHNHFFETQNKNSLEFKLKLFKVASTVPLHKAIHIIDHMISTLFSIHLKTDVRIL